MAQGVEHLHSKHETLRSNTSTTKKKKRKKERKNYRFPSPRVPYITIPSHLYVYLLGIENLPLRKENTSSSLKRNRFYLNKLDPKGLCLFRCWNGKCL
jgi:hypothetical protein